MKYESGTGWPSFFTTIPGAEVHTSTMRPSSSYPIAAPLSCGAPVGRPLPLVGVLASESVDERDDDREKREEAHHQRPAAAEQLAEGQPEDDADHRFTR